MGNDHVCKLEVGEGRFYRNHKIFSHFDLVKEYLIRLLHVVQCLHCFLVLYQFSEHDLPITNVDKTHQVYKRIVGVSHAKVFYSLQPLVVNFHYHDFLQGTVHVLEQMTTVEIILALLIHDGDVSVCRVDSIFRRATRFTWIDRCNFRLECVFLTAHDNVHASMLPPPKLDSNLLAFVMHCLCMTIMERNVGFSWARVRGLCVNDSHILSTAGTDTTTTMLLWMVYKLIYL